MSDVQTVIKHIDFAVIVIVFLIVVCWAITFLRLEEVHAEVRALAQQTREGSEP